MMPGRLRLIVVFGLFTAACQPGWQVSTEEVVARHIAAVGGESALRQVKAWHAVAVVHDLPDPGKIETWVESPGKVRIDSSISGVDETIAYDGQEGWSRGPRGVERLTGKRTRSIRNKGYLDDILASRAGNGTITRQDDETVDGRRCHVLVLGPSSEDSVTAYVDSSSFLIAKTVTPMMSPKGTRMRLEIRYSDYRMVSGVMMPFKREVRADYGNYRITTESVEVGVNPDDSLFEAPGKRTSELSR
jgi:hypothetical protein